MNGELLKNDSNLRERINAFREKNGLQTFFFVTWSWVHKYTASKRWLGKSRRRRFVQEILWHKMSQCWFKRHYLPSWVPIHTVPAVSPDPKRYKKTQKTRGKLCVCTQLLLWEIKSAADAAAAAEYCSTDLLEAQHRCRELEPWGGGWTDPVPR